MKAQDILNFWYKEIDEAKWFKKDLEFDQLITERFTGIHEQARQSALFDWRETPEGRLAEIIILDQFSRNMFRDTPRAFAQDPLALALAQEAVSLGIHKRLEKSQQFFLIMPYMHSESLKVHDVGLKLFEEYGSTDYEIMHRDIIVKFGRYPHRNEILGRKSSPEEIAFLNEPNSSF